MENNLNNIVVVGGGTAGWMTALMVKQRIPWASVTVVESEELGILGAGEGSTPTFINFLNYVGIAIEDMITEVGATFKNSLRFVNWNGSDDVYYHEFAPITALNSDKMFHNKDNFGKHILFYWLNIDQEVSYKEFDFVSMVSELNKAPFQRVAPISTKPTLVDYKNVNGFGLHFDANKLAKFFKKTALTRGIKWVEGKVVSVVEDENRDIKFLKLASGEEINLDFVFDCSGTHRLLIGGHYKSEWVSREDILPCNSALPFFLPMDDSVPSYTECIAMKHGWVWKIPLQDRYGCGYVFDSNHISEEEAAKEIEEWLGHEPLYPRASKGAFKFNPGYYKNTWINNCVAIGLSSGFMEPLEATNIGVALINLTDVLSDLGALSRRLPKEIENYNTQVLKLNSEIAEFLYMHYVTERNDTEFWVKFKDKNRGPKRLGTILSSLATSVPSVVPLAGWDAFNYGSFYQIALGTRQINIDLVKDSVLKNKLPKLVYEDFYSFREFLKSESKSCVDHRTFIKELGGFTNE